jgi:hypothetical protein
LCEWISKAASFLYIGFDVTDVLLVSVSDVLYSMIDKTCTDGDSRLVACDTELKGVFK